MGLLDIDADATRKQLVAFLREGFAAAGLKKAVVGLSGGVDSAAAAFLAAEAVGAAGVATFFLPYRSSDPQSRRHARLVAEVLKVTLQEIDISPQVDIYFERFSDAGRIRRGNKMARERMSILFDHASALGALVVGTSNRTEILLGYGTLFGDTACSINPLAGLLKAQVFQLAAALGIPEEIRAKPPSADLWPGQTDEDELGFRYEDADRLIFMMRDRQLDDGAIEKEGFDAALIARVRDLIARYAFKRRPPLAAGPPVPAGA